MHVRDALERRMTIRAFKPDPVPRQTVLDIMADAARTPSWADSQPWEVWVAGGEVVERLRAAFVRAFEEGVPGDPGDPGADGVAGRPAAAHERDDRRPGRASRGCRPTRSRRARPSV